MSTTEDARRFAVTDAPAMAPGQCFITKTGVGPFIDTKVDVSPPGKIDRGRIYISAEAVKEMAEQLGFLDTPEEHHYQLKDAYDLGYNKGYEEATKEDLGGNITRVTADLGELLGQLTTYMVPAGSEAPEDVGPLLQIVESTGGSEPVGDAGADESATESGEPEPKKSSTRSRKRPNRVSADTGNAASSRI